MAEPGQRASVPKLVLAQVEALPASERDRVLAQLDPEWLDGVRRAARTAWVPLDWTPRLYRAVDEALGDARVMSVARDMAAGTYDVPLFAPLIRGALNVFGDGAASLLRTLPGGWKLVNRGAGRCEVEIDRGARVATVSLRELAPPLRDRPFARSWVGTLHGIFDQVDGDRADGDRIDGDARVEADLDALADGLAHYRANW